MKKGRLIRRIDVNVKNLYWADSGDLVAIASDTSSVIDKEFNVVGYTLKC
ncbi:coatomer subunit beta'-1-like [Cucumis melo var. makuwa]|uniref:Coatomer subunit beta'-1-like n=1 Tax=Cucumis melo var. makuwa TaxID=1194695 RepID=A0A5A7V4A8_CUCMM|nr:coatomer subunit beta'-1-like [Cucumis melo var. makuwa]